MEDVLEVYKRPYDPKHPLICMDEMPKQLLTDTRETQPLQPGKAERFDYEYKRGGVADMFLLFEPLAGKRHIEITEQWRRVKWAEVMRIVADELYPEAEKIVVVLDNLNSHVLAAFYLTFEPCEARLLIDRFEFHYTPKHGSWLKWLKLNYRLWFASAWIAVFQTKPA